MPDRRRSNRRAPRIRQPRRLDASRALPLETDVISDVLAEHGQDVDGVLLAPAYVDAGRVTINGIHMLHTDDGLIPVADTEFARDATFGYRSSRLADWVAEKSGGRIRADDVVEITLEAIRTEPFAELAARLANVRHGQIVVADAVTDDDLRALALAVIAAEKAGSEPGIPHRAVVRARPGRPTGFPPIDDATLADLVGTSGHGLVVVGSHVGLTGRQLSCLADRRQFVHVELDVPTLSTSAASRLICGTWWPPRSRPWVNRWWC